MASIGDILLMIGDLLYWLAYTFYAYLDSLYRLIVPPALKSLHGDIALVTGAGGGIGSQICLQLGKAGATVVCWDNDKASNDKIVKQLKANGVKAFGYQVDVTSRQQVADISAQVKSQVGDVSLLVNNAGVAGYYQFLQMSQEEYDRVMDINLNCHMYIMREFLPKMLEKKSGHIVATCSMAGHEVFPYSLPYIASKFAVNGYMRALRREVSQYPSKPDIKFTSIYPITINTGIITNMVKLIPKRPWHEGIMLDPAYAGKVIADGIRRNQEDIFVPPSCRALLWLRMYLPTKAWWKLMDILEPEIVPLKKD